MRIRILWEGKTKEAHLRELENDYVRRILRFNDIVIEEVPRARKTDREGKLSSRERQWLEKLHGSVKVFLDPRGREWTSQEFAGWMGQQAVHGRRELAFLVGGEEGFSSAFRREADLLLALSRMTLTHEWARVLLLEQIYRAFAILHGFPYAR